MKLVETWCQYWWCSPVVVVLMLLTFTIITNYLNSSLFSYFSIHTSIVHVRGYMPLPERNCYGPCNASWCIDYYSNYWVMITLNILNISWSVDFRTPDLTFRNTYLHISQQAICCLFEDDSRLSIMIMMAPIMTLIRAITPCRPSPNGALKVSACIHNYYYECMQTLWHVQVACKLEVSQAELDVFIWTVIVQLYTFQISTVTVRMRTSLQYCMHLAVEVVCHWL